MKILIAEDEPISRHLLEANLIKWGHEVVACQHGAEAWDVLQQPGAPSLAILDWMMPHLDGVDLCRMIRDLPHGQFAYLIMLTAKTEQADIIQGLGAGADDYVFKPWDPEELRARIQVGQRVIGLQNRLIEAERNRVLTEAAGAAAHEINQPLTVLVGTAELLMIHMSKDHKDRENIQAIYDASQRISSIVKKMSQIRQYVTKPYIDNVNIVDIDASANQDGNT